MSEQDVHEIQLNGKQLVFMFMAATVVSVVIFLCGVMVGRGVRQPLPTLGLGTESPVDQVTSPEAGSAPVDVADPGKTPSEPLTYAERLQSTGTPKTAPLTPSQSRPSPAAEKAATVEPPPPRESPAPSDAPPRPAPAQTAGVAESAGKGWVVQVQAFPKQADADALAGRLKSKGYNAFVALNPKEGPGKYRVRVGTYPNKPEAEAMAVRLRQEERFTPWVTQ